MDYGLSSIGRLLASGLIDQVSVNFAGAGVQQG